MTTLERFLALFLGFLSLLAIYLLQPILMPFMLGIVLAYLGDPLVDRLENWGLNRAAGSSVVGPPRAVVIPGRVPGGLAPFAGGPHPGGSAFLRHDRQSTAQSGGRSACRGLL